MPAEIVDINLKVNRCEFDGSLYREKVKDMNTAQISNLIKNVFKPDKQFPFTKTNGRSFRLKKGKDAGQRVRTDWD